MAVTNDSIYSLDRSIYKTTLSTGETVQLVGGENGQISVYDGWVYYCRGGGDSKFCRVSINGGKPQRLLNGWMHHYDFVDGWIYYLTNHNPTAIQRMRPDGSEQSIVYKSQADIITFGNNKDKLAVSISHGTDARGKPVPTDLLVLDIATGAVTQAFKTRVGTIYTAQDYIYYYDENGVRHFMNLTTGETGTASPTPGQNDTQADANGKETEIPNVIANYSANLFMSTEQLGSGLFAADGDMVYFANPYDGGSLYRIKIGESNPQKLLDKGVAYLSVVEGTIYFCDKGDNYAICSIGTDGQNFKILSKGRADELSFNNDLLVFRNRDTIRTTSKDGGNPNELIHGKVRNVYATNGWVYYIEDHEAGGLWRIPIGGGDPQPLLTDHPAKFYAITGNVLFCMFDGGDSVDIARMNLDGSEQTIVFSIKEKLHAINLCRDRLLIVKNDEDGSHFMVLILNPEDYTVQDKLIGLSQPSVWCFGSYAYYFSDDGLVRENLDIWERTILAR